ncbi:MAG: type II toxin-antitoxin system death-on-curing family toxin [Candidatus Paceibacterota bacterium]
MKYLSLQDVVVFNALVIEATGGKKGLRDAYLLKSLIERPKTKLFGEEKFETVFDKAATYLESLARYHVFVDGNKRTALIASSRFLFLNGYRLTANNREAGRFVLRVATGEESLETIAIWFKKYSEKIGQ